MVSGTYGSSADQPKDEAPVAPLAPEATPDASLAGDVAAALIVPVAEQVSATVLEKVKELAGEALHVVAEELDVVAHKLDPRLIGGIDVTPFHK